MRQQTRPTQKMHSRVMSSVVAFIKDSRATGIVLICCTFISMLLSNSFFSDAYLRFWEKDWQPAVSWLHLPHTTLHLVNDAFMAIFFLLAGLEIKREFLIGSLAGFKRGVLPIMAAIGGMVVPALIYALCCGGTPYANGWGIPMATDIAFSLGILSLLGKKAPLSIRIFLTALAIIDDLGGILTIAIFYTSHINGLYLLLAAAILVLLLVLNAFKVKPIFAYLIPGILLWYFVFNSGVHATVAGILLAFTLPLFHIEQLEHKLHNVVNFAILPIFALANTAIPLPSDYSIVFTSRVHYGILLGLYWGKPIGIFLFSYLAVKSGLASLPDKMTWYHVAGLGLLAGIGFTISIFITTLAFPDLQTQLIGKIAVIEASLLAGITGYIYLRLVNKKADSKVKSRL